MKHITQFQQGLGVRSIIALFTFMLLSAATMAQAPQEFKYQAVARDAAGSPLASANIAVKASILDNGTSVYSERQTATTNTFGLFNLSIGTGTVLSGTFNTINWSTGNKSIKLEVDFSGGTNYVTMGTAPLESVPYALYSQNPGPTGPQGPQGPAGQNGQNGQNGATGPQGPAGSANINGTTNYVVKFTGATTGGNSQIFDNGTQVAIGTTTPLGTTQTDVRSHHRFGGYFNTDSASGTAGAIRGEFVGGAYDGAGNEGLSVGHDGFGIGGFFASNNVGTFGYAQGSTAITTSTIGTYGLSVGALSQRIGAYGEADSGTVNVGVWGTTSGIAGATNYAGYFSGDVNVTGTLSKAAGTFRIDHPQDPANKYLIHSFVESPDMMNVYNGNITTDGNGDANVELPSYFEAENIDFKYQLTVIGQFSQAIVAEKVSNNHFKIKTDKPNVEVSWQVTGVRNDAYAQKHRIIPVVMKEGDAKGKYLSAESYGLSNEFQYSPVKIKPVNVQEHLTPLTQQK